MVAGIILAAGRSRRMGPPKAHLRTPDGQSFVARLMRALREGGIDTIFVVGREDDEPLRIEVATADAGVRYVGNAAADIGGQLSSLIAGLEKADRPGIRGVLVVPVDVPLITADTVATLIAAFSATSAPVVRARHREKNGHPVIFARATFDELRHADPAVGAKAVLRAHEGTIVNVDVDDPAVIDDVDTPEDYARLLGRTR